MRWLWTIGLVLTMWSAAAAAFSLYRVRDWFRGPPTPVQAELRERDREEAQRLVVGAGAAGAACLVVAWLGGAGPKALPTRLARPLDLPARPPEDGPDGGPETGIKAG